MKPALESSFGRVCNTIALVKIKVTKTIVIPGSDNQQFLKQSQMKKALSDIIALT
jgi:hypothetical protein